MSSELPPQNPDFTIQEERLQYGAEKKKQHDTARLIWASKALKEPSHKEKSIMIDSVMKYQEPQINADKRRFVVPVFSSFLFLIATNQQNNHFFAYFGVKNSANRNKRAMEHLPNIFDEVRKVKIE